MTAPTTQTRSQVGIERLTDPVIVSLSSQVVYGHVGNCAAVPALQALGFEVLALPTVLLAHHPGHRLPRGRMFPVEEVAALLEGICPEVVDMLKDQHFPEDIMRHLRKMKPARQIECAELMISLNNFSAYYAAALLAATPPAQLVEPERPKKFRGLSAEQMARMEHEMALVQNRFKAIEQSYGSDVLNMVLARGYVVKLLSNKAVARFLEQNYAEFLHEFRTIAATASLDEATKAGG